jgi:hypothetical protein
MFQMIDAAFTEARGFCIRDHIVVEDACWFSRLHTRVLRSHAIDLTALENSGPFSPASQTVAVCGAARPLAPAGGSDS